MIRDIALNFVSPITAKKGNFAKLNGCQVVGEMNVILSSVVMLLHFFLITFESSSPFVMF